MWLTVRETVAIETPARLATSRILTALGRRRSEDLFLAALTSGSIVTVPGVSQVSSASMGDWNWRESKRIAMIQRAGRELKEGGNGQMWKAFPRKPAEAYSLSIRFSECSGRCGVVRVTGGDVEGVIEDEKNRFEAFDGALLASRQVDDESAAFQACHSARQRSEYVLERTAGAHELGNSRCFTVDHAPGRLWRAIARSQAGSACREHKGCAMRAPLFDFFDDCVFLVWNDGRIDAGLGVLPAQNVDDRRTCGVSHLTL